MPSVLPKTSTSAQNMKTGTKVLKTAENDSERAKQEYGTRHP
jgi:alanine dehydrogenase